MARLYSVTNGAVKPGPGITIVTFVDDVDEKPPAEPPTHEFNPRTLRCEWCDIAKKDALMHRLTRCEGPFRQAAPNGCEVVPVYRGPDTDGTYRGIWWQEVKERWPEQAAKAETDNSQDAT